MNVAACLVALRPRGPFEVGDLVFVLLRARRALLWDVFRWWLAPIGLLGSIAAVGLGGSLVVAGLMLLIGPLLRAPLVLVFGRSLFQERVPLREALRDVASRLPALAVGWGASLLLFLFGTLFLMIGGPLVVAPAVFATESALLERSDGVKSASRALRLAAAEPLGALVAGAIGTVLPVVGGVAAEVSGQGVLSVVLQLPPVFGSLWEGVTTPFVVVGILVGHLLASVWRLLLYVDARTRDEGWDLQVGLRAVAAALDARRGGSTAEAA